MATGRVLRTDASPAETRRSLRLLRLRGSRILACRGCRAPIRLLIGAPPPATCPACGAVDAVSPLGLWRRVLPVTPPERRPPAARRRRWTAGTRPGG